MTLSEFREQDTYCRLNNTPEGKGCDNCPAKDKEHCADALRNLCGKLLKATSEDANRISSELNKIYGITPFAQLALFNGILEFDK